MAIEAEFRSILVQRPAIVPTLRIDVDLSASTKTSIRTIAAYISVRNPQVEMMVGGLNCYDLPISLAPAKTVSFYLELDPWKLEKIEEFRKGGDLRFKIHAACSAMDFSKDPPRPFPESFWVEQKPYGTEFRIPKSDWTERYLGELGYKRSRLLEIPVIEAPSELNELVRHVDDAWKHYSTGYYLEVLTSCRRGLEVVERFLMKKGFKKMKELKGEQRPVADWTAFLGGSTVGEYVEGIFEGLKAFTSPGAHAGRDISKPEADYALMCTHGLASYFLKTMSRGS